LVLLHGLGATSDVWTAWRALLARRWPGRWLAPDPPGHGGSPPLAAYTFDGFAAAVAGLVQPSSRVVVLGHSLCGVVGLTLASERSPVAVRAVIGLGIKVVWTEEDLERARAAAQRQPAWFASRDEAAARYLRVSGLAGLLPASDPAIDAGLREQDGRWRLAMDPGAFAVGAPDMAQLLARSQAPVTLEGLDAVPQAVVGDHRIGDDHDGLVRGVGPGLVPGEYGVGRVDGETVFAVGPPLQEPVSRDVPDDALRAVREVDRMRGEPEQGHGPVTYGQKTG
jgi:pimeloyl-ACP methyl ester carboxylesterase